jgi:hypothetical protein
VIVDTLPPHLAQAVDELEQAFLNRITIESHDATGLVIQLRDVPLAERWTPRVGSLWFVIPYNYPDAPVYPYYVVDATATGGAVPALRPVTWRDMAAIQVSLRQTAWDPARDTVVGCVVQTQSWLRLT